MAIAFLKPLERRIRQGAMRSLKRFVRRNRALPSNFDFNRAKILCLRQNQIGDTLISTPIFAALKRRYPDIVIDALLDKRNATALDTNPHVRKRFVLKRKLFDFFKAMIQIRAERYDIIADLVHTPSSLSTLFCLFGKSRFVVGFERENDFIYDVKVPFKKETRMLRALAEILTAFGIEPDKENLRPVFPLPPDSLAFAERIARSFGDKKIVGVNISASLKIKFWGAEKFASLIRLLRSDFPDAAFLVLYAKAYARDAQTIAERSGARLCEETQTLSDFAAVVSKLDLLITPDSAAVHLADAFNVPCVVLTHNPDGATAWYPSFCHSCAIHSKTGEVSSIEVAEVYRVAERFAREQLEK
ncbi:MAG: glycosyltransferase family 9 protein [Chloroherpetonaceae bacterium]|nr:glycosyltransferase family 9 protein [Chloroherpetonaceae bacterium]